MAKLIYSAITSLDGDIHDRWISRYATGAVDLLARLKRDLEADDPRQAVLKAAD